MMASSLYSWGNQVPERMKWLARDHPDSHGDRAPTVLCKTFGLGVTCCAWLSPSYTKAPFFLRIKSEDSKLSPLNCWGVIKVHPERSCCFCLFMKAQLYMFFFSFLFNVFLPPPAWFGTMFSLGRVLEPNPWWRSQAWQPPFVSILLGLRIYLWCQAWARFRIIQGCKSWGYEK